MVAYISHDIVASDEEGQVVARAEAEDRESAEVAARTLVIEDGAESATIIRRRDGQVVGWHHRVINNGVVGVRQRIVFND